MLRQGVSSLPPPHPPPQTRRSARVAPKASEDQRVQRCAEIRPRSHAYISERNKNCWRNTPFAWKFVSMFFFSQNLGGVGANPKQKLSSWELWQVLSFSFGSFGPRPVVWGICFFSAEKYQAFTTWPCKSLPFFFQGVKGLANVVKRLDHLTRPKKNRSISWDVFFKRKLTANQ